MGALRMMVWVGSLVMTCASIASAEDGISTNADLMTVLALQGLPCGQVVQVTQQGDQDFLVVCKDRNRYRVFVNASGRVVASRK